MNLARRFSPKGIRLAATGLLTWALSAGATDISTIPLILLTTGQARPNVMFILDDSGSMADDFVPDAANYNNRCFGYFGLNAIFYNPAKTYTPPKREDGTSYPAAAWPRPLSDGFAGGSTTNLNSAPYTKGSDTFYYSTLKSGRSAPSTCNSSGTADFNLVTPLAAAEQQNYANWFSYYRTKVLAMRTAVGATFTNGVIDASKIRVGFSTISETGVADTSSKFLNIRNFDANVTISGVTRTQRQWFFNRMYAATPSGYTPLRPALEKAGRYFANKQVNGTPLPAGSDPVQYSCQRNFALLSTDGYWNKDDETNYRNPYTPQGVKSSVTLGNQDGGSTPRPFFDNNLSSGSLADIAYYYYVTDLRDNTVNSFGNCTGALGTDVCSNDVVPTGRDTARWQHMTTYTLGIGVVGTLPFRPDYESATSGSYYNILTNTGSPNNWPDPLTGSSSSTVTQRVDDLWHAAVNGRGYYYNATDAAALAASLGSALGEIGRDPGSAAAASTSTLKPVSGDDKIFVGKYVPSSWSGKLESYTISTTTGALLTPDSPNWEAGALLKARNLTTSPRAIYFFKSSAANKLASFASANLSATQQGYFNGLCSAAKLSQCATLTASALTKSNSAANVIDYVSGKSTYEFSAAAADDQVFRTRVTPLGDLVNASPVYVMKPPFKYADAGYAAFASGSTRSGVVYTAANDGMLHAFDATTGAERWAYIPSAVMSEMYRLADNTYTVGLNHRFYVDATPVVGDIFDGSNWRTILVGGLGAGGRSYYALDITDPANPIGLWEFADTQLGLTYGNPIISKLKSGTWAVILNSGYDNNSGGGDGNGRIYVLNALTGAALATPVQTYTTGATPAGTTATPNNLGGINAWVADETNNTLKRVYAGDMLGNLWRFDIDDNIDPSGNESFLLARATTPGGAGQPISVRPQLTEITANGSPVALVAFAAGRYLGVSDLTDASTESLYVVKDTLGNTPLGALRTNATMVRQSMSAAHTLNNPTAVNYATNSGWYVDFDQSSKERVTVEMQQQLSTLAVATNIPTATACSPGGTGYLYYFDLTSAKILQSQLFTTPIVGISSILVGTAGGKSGSPVTEVTGGNGTITPVVDPTLMGTSGLTPRRTSWRELTKK